MCFIQYSQPFNLTLCLMKQIQLYFGKIDALYEYTSLSSTLTENVNPFLMMYWVFIVLFFADMYMHKPKEWLTYLKSSYLNPCSKPLVDKGHVPIQICSQDKIMDDIQRMEGRNPKGREKKTPHQMLLLVFLTTELSSQNCTLAALS